MFVVVVQLSSDRMQTSGTIGIVGLKTRYRLCCCLVVIMRRTTVHVYTAYVEYWRASNLAIWIQTGHSKILENLNLTVGRT